LGSAVAELLLESGWRGKFKRIAVPDQFCRTLGERDYLRECLGLSSDKITEEIIKTIKN